MKLYLSLWEPIICDYDVMTEEVYVWQCRTLTMEEFDKKYGKKEGTWKSKGINHKDSNGCCYRQEKKTLKYIEINSLEELVKLLGHNKYYIYTEYAPSKEENTIFFIGQYDYME